MKLTLKYLLLSAAAVLGMSSCSDVLDVAPDGTLTLDEVFQDPDKTGAFLNSCYANLPYKGYFYWGWEAAVTACSDDGWTCWDGSNNTAASKVYSGDVSATSHSLRDGWSGNDSWMTNKYWTRYWEQIRLCNIFLENIDNAAVNSEAQRDRMRAEAHVLRAYFYSELVKWFGKVPVLDHSVDATADFSDMKRQSVYKVAKFIEEDCDMAIYSDNLPWRIETASEARRVTKALAWTIKSKMMLFAASPLFNEGQNHWEEAFEMNRAAVRELKSHGYELFTICTNPNTFGTGDAACLRQLINTAADYSGSPSDEETIWQQYGMDCFVWHIGYVGSGIDGTYSAGISPTQELVDAFNTLDGEPVLDLSKPYLDDKHLHPNYNPNSQYDPNNPFANRDPRMDETLLHNGSTFYYQGEKRTIETFEGGANAINLTASVDDFTRTGYYHCKFVQPGASQGSSYAVNTPPWKFFRLAEVILNYAEAAAEAGHLTEAKDAVDEIRARVKMPALPDGLSQQDMILRVRNERQVELAWEECRYYDLRRWQQPDGDLYDTCRWLTGMRPIPRGDGTYSYERYNIWQIPRGGSSNRDLLLPLPIDEVSRLDAVTGDSWQNPGW